MATIAFDDLDEERAAKPPISMHPAFPAVVALWFSALLGLGSLVLPAVLLDRFVAASGIAALVPAAGPPLGVAARALIALVAAVAGALLGLMIARRVATAHAPDPETRLAKFTDGLKRPISVHEELGGEGVINGHGLPINRRRALAISEDERPSDFLYTAPLPGEDPHADSGPEPAAEERPLELRDMVEDGPSPALAGFDSPDEDEEIIDTQDFEPVSPFQDHGEPAWESGSGDELGARGLEALPFSPPSLVRRAPEPLEEPWIEAEPELDMAIESESEVANIEPVPVSPRADWATASLEELGLVQLVQRLGSTIERRREWLAENAPAQHSPEHAPALVPLAGVEAAEPAEAAQAMAAYFGSTAGVEEPAPSAPLDADETNEAAPPPQFLRGPVLAAVEEDDPEEALPDFNLPLRRAPAAPAAITEAGNEGDEDYASLLAANNPFAAGEPEFVRIDEPQPETDAAVPAVVFPGQDEPVAPSGPALAPRLFDQPGKAPAANFGAPQQASGDADSALRAALATLQRMSGAA